MNTFKFLNNNIQPLTQTQWLNITVPDDIVGAITRTVYRYGYQAAMRGEPLSSNPNLRTEYCYTWNRGWLAYHVNQPINNVYTFHIESIYPTYYKVNSLC